MLKISPEKRAASIIKEMGFTEPPIDVEKICEYLGIELVFFDRKVGNIFGAAMSFPAPDGTVRTVLSVNSRPPIGPRRFTIAHEIGHFVLGHLKRDRRWDWQEREADRFAGELLMPDDIFATEWCWYDLDSLALRYAVSVTAAEIRTRPYNIEMVI